VLDVTFIEHLRIPVEMLDDPPVLEKLAHGNPFLTAKDMIDPDSMWAVLRVEWPSASVFQDSIRSEEGC
jgi:hypothetical protein